MPAEPGSTALAAGVPASETAQAAAPLESEAAGPTPAGDASPFEAKYAGANKSKLRAAHVASETLYDANAKGRVQERERALDTEAPAELDRELAWLKEKAFGGL